MAEYRRVVRKKRKKKSVFKRIMLLLLLVLIAGGGYLAYIGVSAYQAADKSFQGLERGEKSELREQAVELAKDPVSILIMGVEDYSTGGKGGRSDTLIVMTLNPKEKSMKMLSIPRDTLVDVEGHGETKITHAYSYGGKELTVQTVEDFLDIPIDYYATVNFEAFKKVIDELGGVEVDVPFDFSEKSDVTGKRIYFKEGKQTLDGEEALAYARMRKQDPRGDFGRNDRQKEIITAIIKKATSPQNILKVDDIANQISENVETNLRISEAMGFQQKYSGFKTSQIDQLKIEGEDLNLQSGYYFQPLEEELEQLKDQLKDHLDHKTVSIREERGQSIKQELNN
ncbi:LytR family transcriptional regulator [Bacillus mangrovi]|uniref:LytR family transcriptional regulator n=1 Tax=Metabacillus mangrovi TaxID=1491830 RepID=A0A7X2S8B4_9BACI|nr:LCP family protein [Metabacillus mangrovi]MTH55046.1 LytR family transcriptional regulator [Metabacillus mangrovi]